MISPDNPFDKMTPCERISFAEIEKICHIEAGDWLLEKKTDHSFWSLYKPETNESYSVYHIGLSNDPTNLFYASRKIDRTVVKQSDEIMISIIKESLNKLIQPQSRSRFSFATNNAMWKKDFTNKGPLDWEERNASYVAKYITS